MTRNSEHTKPAKSSRKGGPLSRAANAVAALLRVLLWTAVLIMWACAATVYVSPATYGKYIGLVGLGFPFCVAAVVALSVLCLLFRPRLVGIGVVGLLGCFGTVRDYFPVNFASPPPKGCLKVISYNIMGFGGHQKDSVTGEFLLLPDLLSRGADIINMQESNDLRTNEEISSVERSMRRYGYYFQRENSGTGNSMAIASRMPIVKSRRLCLSRTNGAYAFYLSPRAGDTIIVVNVHLESNHLTKAEKEGFHEIALNPGAADTVRGKRRLIESIAESSRTRALQADTLAWFIEQNKGRKLILTGDFNDTPISYSHHRICHLLTDTYRATGNGLGRTYNKNAMVIRIDHLFCSSHYKPYAASVDDSAPLSDHYPVTVYLKENR